MDSSLLADANYTSASLPGPLVKTCRMAEVAEVEVGRYSVFIAGKIMDSLNVYFLI